MTISDPARGKFGNASGKTGGTAGSFTDHTHSAPEAAAQLVPRPFRLGALEPSSRTPETLTSAQLASHSAWSKDLIALEPGPDGATDLFVGSVVDGRLSRGTPGATGAAALKSWRLDAQRKYYDTGDRRYLEFSNGVASAGFTLFKGKVEAELEGGDGWETWELKVLMAEKAAATKRASVADREEWRTKLKRADSDAEWRGMMVAGAALSGTDSWWGMRADTDRTMLGD